LDLGAVNIKVMELLDRCHNSILGNPAPKEVKLTPTPGKCILVSGHDLIDLQALLK